MKINKKDLLSNKFNEASSFGDVMDKTKSMNLKDAPKDTLNYNILDNNYNGVVQQIKSGIKPTMDDLNYALTVKNPQIIDIIIKNGIKPTTDSLIRALKSKDKNVVDVILKNGAKPDPKYRTLDWAIITNNIDIVNEMIKLGDKASDVSLPLAINTGNFDIVKSVILSGKLPTQSDVEYAKKQKTRNFKIIDLLEKNI